MYFFACFLYVATMLPANLLRASLRVAAVTDLWLSPQALQLLNIRSDTPTADRPFRRLQVLNATVSIVRLSRETPAHTTANRIAVTVRVAASTELQGEPTHPVTRLSRIIRSSKLLKLVCTVSDTCYASSIYLHRSVRSCHTAPLALPHVRCRATRRHDRESAAASTCARARRTALRGPIDNERGRDDTPHTRS